MSYWKCRACGTLSPIGKDRCKNCDLIKATISEEELRQGQDSTAEPSGCAVAAFAIFLVVVALLAFLAYIVSTSLSWSK